MRCSYSAMRYVLQLTPSVSGFPCLLLQVVALTRLQKLILCKCIFDEAADYQATVPLLTSLRSLCIERCNRPPTCISRLTSLKHLRVISRQNAVGEEVAQFLRAAVQPLTQLTLLTLGDLGTADVSVLQGLPRLRELQLHQQSTADPVQLPGGSWMGCLRSLAVEARVLARSLASLGAATQLQNLRIYDFPNADGATHGALLQWAGSSAAPLRSLRVDRLPASSGDAALAAMLGKPGLHIREVDCSPVLDILTLLTRSSFFAQ